MIFWAAFAAVAAAFAVSSLGTAFVRRLAPKLNMIDMPLRHKAHAKPVPLLGGSAVFAGFLLPSLLILAVARYWSHVGIPQWAQRFDSLAIHIPGAAAMAPFALWILGGAFLFHVLGLIDDRKALGPWVKLVAQVVICSAVVAAVPRVRILTVLDEILGPASSAIVTVIWLVIITNAFNFLDNMDGLSAGVAMFVGAALLGAALSMQPQQVFVAGWLCLLLGSLAGFLPYNFPPASIFMGDSGSLVVGFLLGVLSCLVTYVPPGGVYYLYGVFVPIVLMAVPLYDMVSVVTLRLRDRKNPMVGDRRHFSHRLVRRGMKVRTAVLTIYLCTAGTAIAASLLPRVDSVGAVLILAQTFAILLIIALLEGGNDLP